MGGDGTTGRQRVLADVAGRVPDLGPTVLLAVDGRDGAGKTTFADELAVVLRAAGRTVVRASVDGFHHPRERRHRRGRRSAAGYWLDAYDYGRLRAELLDPLRPGGSGVVRTAVHDVRTDAELAVPPVRVEPGTVLVLDGVFLHRDELHGYFDVSVYLQVDIAVTRARMAVRDGTDPADPAHARYAGAQEIYARSRPAGRADVVVDNTDLAAPRVVRAPK